VADGQDLSLSPGQFDQFITVVQPRGHRLLQQQVPPGGEDGRPDLVVQVRRQHDIDEV
jgi:hypothetical protein